MSRISVGTVLSLLAAACTHITMGASSALVAEGQGEADGQMADRNKHISPPVSTHLCRAHRLASIALPFHIAQCLAQVTCDERQLLHLHLTLAH